MESLHFNFDYIGNNELNMISNDQHLVLAKACNSLPLESRLGMFSLSIFLCV